MSHYLPTYTLLHSAMNSITVTVTLSEVGAALAPIFSLLLSEDFHPPRGTENALESLSTYLACIVAKSVFDSGNLFFEADVS